MLNIIESSIFLPLCYIYFCEKKSREKMETKRRNCWFFQLSSNTPQNLKQKHRSPHSSLTRETYSFKFRALFFQVKINATWAATDNQEFLVPLSFYFLVCWVSYGESTFPAMWCLARTLNYSFPSTTLPCWVRNKVIILHHHHHHPKLSKCNRPAPTENRISLSTT